MNDQLSASNVVCPFCGGAMVKMYFMIGGGVWGSESKEAMDIYGRIEEAERFRMLTQKSPLHCFIGNKGYSGGGNWPKAGWYCKNNAECSTIIFKPKP